MRKEEQIREAECGRFREELELLRGQSDSGLTRDGLLERLPAEVRSHLGDCERCGQAFEDVVETRRLLWPLAGEANAAQPGPWFSSKVMNAIAAKEAEIETREGVWTSVRKLAPRLAAVCALLLVLMGTWAVQTQRAFVARQNRAAWDSLFEPGPSVALNDDVLAGEGARR